ISITLVSFQCTFFKFPALFSAKKLLTLIDGRTRPISSRKLILLSQK
ncbi:unnamed protein product, partial [Tenebrio molitor]